MALFGELPAYVLMLNIFLDGLRLLGGSNGDNLIIFLFNVCDRLIFPPLNGSSFAFWVYILLLLISLG